MQSEKSSLRGRPDVTNPTNKLKNLSSDLECREFKIEEMVMSGNPEKDSFLALEMPFFLLFFFFFFK